MSTKDYSQSKPGYRLSDPMIVLIGPMGSGKTSIGRRLAQVMRLRFVDIDAEVELNAGVSIRDIFNNEGEVGFRKRETAALDEHYCLSGTVISTGGGAILTEANRKMMRNGVVIYLHASPEQQYERVKNRTNRPKLDPSRPLAGLADLMEVREPLYRSEADLIVRTNGKTVDAIVKKIQRYLQEL